MTPEQKRLGELEDALKAGERRIAVFTMEDAKGVVLATVTIQGPCESLELDH